MEQRLSKVHIFITGGTIDSYYNGTKDTVECLPKTSIIDFIEGLKVPFEIKYTEICMKDSRSITNDDRKELLEAIINSKDVNVLVTHGTYTMPDTARYIEANLKTKNQKVILTGSMIPLTGFSPSDAPFNLGFALASFKNVNPGVYVAMNAHLFTAEEVIKLVSEGKFVSIFDK